ncbi:MAG: ABC transporter ATP-binding protein [Candidatus Heimdallarchaeota archaeon]|nr:ABC transporter ATP-binding protein [Candidatus Heimdallarchaeota archaeon]
MKNSLAESASDQKLFSQIWIWLRQDKRLIYLLVGVMLLNVMFAIFGPILLQRSVETIIEEDDDTGRYTLYLGLGYSASLFVIFLIQMIQAIIVAKVNSRFIHRIRTNSFQKIIENKVSFFDNSEVGRLVSRITNDTTELADSGNRFAEAFSQIIIFVGVLAVMLYFNFWLTVAATFVIPFLFIGVFSLRKMQRGIALRWRKNLATVNTRFSEVMSSIAISKTFGREQENKNLFQIINEETYQSAKRRGQIIFANGPISDFLRTFGLVSLLYVASIQVTRGESIAIIYLFILLQAFLYNPVTNIARNYSQFQSSFAALERLIQIMADKNTSEYRGQGLSADNIKGEIEFSNVDFSYGNDPILKNISFKIRAGSRVALVGHSGAGKTTIASILMRFYEIERGEILIDGERIQNYDLFEWRKNIGYVSQDVRLLGNTIRENFMFAKPTATEEEIYEALNRVQALEFLENLKEGLDTKIHDGGSNLSQGQKQMLSLARALLVDPKILILDEFSSSLDLYTESKIQNALEEIMKDRTSIVIAHRLTTILKSDKIMVLENGELKEEGTHSELIQSNGKYAEIYAKYFSFQLAGLKPLIKT